MTVMTRLIATVAEIDLQRFKSPTAQPRKVGMSEEGKGSVHRWLENEGTGLASRAPLFLGIPKRVCEIRPAGVASVDSMLKPLQVRSDARGVFAEVALPKARDRAHVDATAAAGGHDTNDDIVLEPKPGRRVGRFDAPFIRCRGDNLPADVAHGIQCIRSEERRVGKECRARRS